jgi:hypothetical protein
MTRMELVKCANPACWRYFPRPVATVPPAPGRADAPRTTCDDACEIARLAAKARAA